MESASGDLAKAVDSSVPSASASGDLAKLVGVSVSYDGVTDVLRDVDFAVSSGERWVIIGPNGCGKSTMVQLLTGYLHPSRGDYSLLGARLGSGVDWRKHRTQIGFVSAALAKQMRAEIAAVDVVMTALHGALEPWWHEYSEADRMRAAYLLDAAGYGYVASRPFGVLSDGERQQVMLARSLMRPPRLLVLDEPAAGLDLGNRERLIARMSAVALGRGPDGVDGAGGAGGTDGVAGMVLVTHHVEEIAPGFTHALLLREGRVVAGGPIDEVLTDENVSAAIGLSVHLRREDDRWTAKVKL